MNFKPKKKKQSADETGGKIFRKPSAKTVSAMRDALAGKGLKGFTDVNSLMAYIAQ